MYKFIYILLGFLLTQNIFAYSQQKLILDFYCHYVADKNNQVTQTRFEIPIDNKWLILSDLSQSHTKVILLGKIEKLAFNKSTLRLVLINSLMKNKLVSLSPLALTNGPNQLTVKNKDYKIFIRVKVFPS